MKKSTIYAEIDICWKTNKKDTGKQGMEYVNEQLNISKGKVSVMSKKIKGSYVNHWTWKTKKYKTLYVDKVLKEILKAFEKKSKILKDIKKTLDVRISLEIVIEMNKKQTPALVIDEKVVEFVNDIGGYIDVDMYII